MSTTRLADLPFLSRLTPELVDLVTRLFQERSYEFGDTIVSEGEEPDGMYVVTSGSARTVTTSDGVEVSLDLIRAGDWFGEAALLGGTTRNATVRASEHLDALFLDRVVFEALVAAHPEVPGALRRQGQVQSLNRLLRVRGGLVELPMTSVGRILDHLEPVHVRAGECVVQQGAPGRYLFLVERGRLQAVRGEEPAAGARVEPGARQIGFFRTGELFGERSLLTGEPCVATVQALTDCDLLRLSRESFEELSRELPSFATWIEEISGARDYRSEARLPLDFGLEILPAGLGADGMATNGAAADGAAADGAAADGAAVDGAAAVAEEARMQAPPGTKRRRRWPLSARHVSFVAQIDEMDCGVACLSMVASYHGISVTTSYLRDVAGTSVSGTTLRSIAAAGRQVGLDVEARRVSRQLATRLPLPAIIHWDKAHWVVLAELSEDRAEVADPAQGIRRLSAAELYEHWDGYAAAITPTGSVPAVASPRPNLRWLRPFLVAHRRSLGVALACALAAAGCEVALPLVVESIVNDVVSPHVESVLDLLGLVMLGLVLGGTLAALLQRLVLVAATARFDIDTLDFVTSRLLGLPLSYFTTRRTGDIERRISGVREIRRIVVQLGIEALTDVTQVAAGIAIMFVLAPILAALFLVTAPLYAVAMKYSSTRLRPLYAGIEESFGRYSSDQVDLLKGIETVKSTSTETGLRRRLRRGFSDYTSRTVSSYRTIAAYGSALQLISLVSYAVFVFAGSILVHDHGLSLGAFVAFTTLVILTSGPLVGLLNIWDDVQVSSVLLNRIADVLEHEPEQGGRQLELAPVPSLDGHVHIVDLTYCPPGADEPVLSEITLEVQPGTTVGVVGRSGSGKSTLLRLLAGLVEPTSGEIRYDRVDIATLDHRALRRRLGLVLQQPYVFALSIAENIALGDDEPDPDAVRAAVEIADLAELVSRLPLGYETLVGDRGLPLSGGQAQRLAIARALYRQPPILLFDEATSSLDSESEATVKRNIDRLLEQRTAFVVAHRLSTVRDADVIVVLERGRLVEQGSHDELMERRGVYYYLCTQQLTPG